MLRPVALSAALLVLTACSPHQRYIAGCQQAIERALTSPASAEWGALEVDVRGRFVEVRGRVDSDNAFGAKLRRFFVCQVGGNGVRWAISEEPFEDFTSRAIDGMDVAWVRGDAPGSPLGWWQRQVAAGPLFTAAEGTCASRIATEVELVDARSSGDEAGDAIDALAEGADECPLVVIERLEELADAYRDSSEEYAAESVHNTLQATEAIKSDSPKP